MNLILIEGLPGSGKSTMAEMLCKAAQARGAQSSWYLEESTDHPVHPAELKNSKYSTDFPEHCLKKWSSFIADKKDKEHLFILEGSLFQSTVRFMLEAKNEELIADYYKACQSIFSAVLGPVNINFVDSAEIKDLHS